MPVDGETVTCVGTDETDKYEGGVASVLIGVVLCSTLVAGTEATTEGPYAGCDGTEATTEGPYAGCDGTEATTEEPYAGCDGTVTTERVWISGPLDAGCEGIVVTEIVLMAGLLGTV
jgi:hypothetical protein